MVANGYYIGMVRLLLAAASHGIMPALFAANQPGDPWIKLSVFVKLGCSLFPWFSLNGIKKYEEVLP